MRNIKKKSIVLIVSLTLLLLILAGGTTAFLIADTAPVTNTFIPTEITSTVDENFDKEVKSDVKIKNTSKDVSAYIRAAVIVNWKNADGAVKPADDDEYELLISETTGWEKSGSYYYYTSAVAPGTETGVLIDSCAPLVDKSSEGYFLDVVVLGSAIQSEPKKAVTESWGVDPTALTN